MTKKYLLLKEQIQSTVGTSEFPPSSTAVKNALDQKVDKNGTDRLMTAAEGTKLSGIAEGAQVNVIETLKVGGVAQTVSDKAVNVPIATASGLGVVKIGTGLSVTAEGLVTADVQLHFEVFDELPTASEDYKNTIALVKKTGTGNDVYNEYVCVQDATTEEWAWELIGSTAFVLNIVQDASGIKINNTALQAATSTQNGLMTKDHVAALETATTNIEGLEESVEGLGTRLTTAETAIEGLDESKADASDLEALETRVGAAESDIEALESDKVDKVTGSSLVADTKVAGYDAHLANADVHVTATQKSSWTGHVESADIHVTAEQKTAWSAKQDALTFDDAPTSGSANPVKSGGVYTALGGKVNAAGVTTIGKDSTGYYIEE